VVTSALGGSLKGIRVVLEPLIQETPLGAFVSSSKLLLQMFGTAAKSLNTEGAQPARLHFLIGFMEKGRDAPPELRRFASYDGQIDVAEPRQPVFTFPTEAEPTFTDPPPSEDELAREIVLEFDETSFANAPESDSPATRLRLPEPPAGMRFAEVGAEIEVNGAVDSAEPENDRLDLVLKEFAEITLFDEDELPLSGARYRIMMGDFEVTNGVLDDVGFARVEGLPLGKCSVVFPDLGEASVRVAPKEEVPPELL
jgi:hypothetical protein